MYQRNMRIKAMEFVFQEYAEALSLELSSHEHTTPDSVIPPRQVQKCIKNSQLYWKKITIGKTRENRLISIQCDFEWLPIIKIKTKRVSHHI